MSLVQIYDLPNYAGNSASFGVGKYDLVGAADHLFVNDTMSSVKVASDVKVIFYFDWKYSGRSLVLTGPINIPDLKTYENGWMDNQMTSFSVEKITQPTPIPAPVSAPIPVQSPTTSPVSSQPTSAQPASVPTPIITNNENAQLQIININTLIFIIVFILVIFIAIIASVIVYKKLSR